VFCATQDVPDRPDAGARTRQLRKVLEAWMRDVRRHLRMA